MYKQIISLEGTQSKVGTKELQTWHKRALVELLSAYSFLKYVEDCHNRVVIFLNVMIICQLLNELTSDLSR